MMLPVLLALMGLGAISSTAVFGLRSAPVYSGLANLAIWLTVAYSASSIDTIAQDGTVQAAATAEPALSALAFGNAALSAIAVLAAATGNYETASESPDTMSMRP